ncbi:Hypothetical_protein [Hexamita inflata]|uniref:Hypothetical_protein n=1 Tax=Hexamita inflata TaxID=28002 RepID=A0AA86UAS0_9EUKA|nr:Hypothetical protein HINF_LOCUS31592 [Hexamita inflata]
MFSMVDTHNRNYLTLNYTQGDTGTYFSSKLANQLYVEISINGLKNSYTPFTDYELLSRTKTLHLTNCLLDLSKLQGKFSSLHLTDCKCFNNFVCSVHGLNTINTHLQLEQLKHLSTDSQFNIAVNSSLQFDFENSFQLENAVTNLTLNDCKINLSHFNGAFISVFLRNCDLFNAAPNFKAKSVYISSCTCKAVGLESLLCETLQIFGQSKSKSAFEIPLRSKAIRKLAEFRGYTIDLSGLAGSWAKIECEDCDIQNFNAQDLNADKCQIENTTDARTELRLKRCELDLNQLVGTWNTIFLDKCKFRTQSIPNDQKIVSTCVYIDDVNLTDFSCFNATHLKVSNCTINCIPQNSNITTDRCKLSLPTTSFFRIHSLTIINCTLYMFSSTYFNHASNIIFKDRHQNYQKMLEVHCKSAQTLSKIIQNRLKRIKQEDKRVQSKILRVQKLFSSQNKIMIVFKNLFCSSE